MMIKKMTWEDTIVAIATPAGIGAIGIIRLSGRQAIDIANHLFPSKNLLAQKSHTLHVGFLQTETSILDEVVLSIFIAPKSYTGENVVEISCHGSPFIMGQVLTACLQKGARLARAGEFTQRAFLNGKLDLAQAESVADLIASNTMASQQAALHYIKGGFSTELQKMREELIKFSALIELELDFSQEDVEFANRQQLTHLVMQIAKATNELLASFRLGNVVKNGVQVAIIGQPNVGKSTLLNALLKEERAIVSDIPGTTRDAIEAMLNINGIIFRLMDTAGIREHATDMIENIGIKKSREKIAQADLVLLMIDIQTILHNPEQNEGLLKEIQEKNKPYLQVINKADLLADDKQALATVQANHPQSMLLHTKDLTAIAALKGKLFELATEGKLNTENTIITNIRHYDALQKLAINIGEVKQGLVTNIPADLLALDIKSCLQHIGEITGQITNEDQLDFIFSKFCIGK